MTSLKRILAFSGLTGVLGALAFAAPPAPISKPSASSTGKRKPMRLSPPSRNTCSSPAATGSYEFFSVSTVCMDIGKGKAPGTVHTGLVGATGTFKKEIVLKSDPDQRRWEVPCGFGKSPVR